ncbi:TPA: pilus assembly protein [Vibrio vulnificus]|nr:pilus assembly protein [Vibrio vulnificus]
MMIRHKGSLTVEVALVLPIFLSIIMGWIEMCMLSYSMSISDHVLSSSVIKAKKAGSASATNSVEYDKLIEKYVKEYAGASWKYFVKDESLKVKIDYFKNYKDLIDCNKNYEIVENCPKRNDNPKNMAIGMYRLEYNYKPLFDYITPDFKVKRELTAIQEYERCSFKIGTGGGCEN